MTLKTPNRLAARLPAAVAALAALSALAAGSAGARCIDEDGAPRALAPAAGGGGAEPLPAAEPRQQLQTMVLQAMQRSRAVGAARLLAEAASSDTEEVRAAKRLSASVSGNLGLAGSLQNGLPSSTGAQARAGINLNQLLFDGGRTDRLTDWRDKLAEAARLGTISAQEQVALQTVSLAVERNRYRLQTQVWQQYARKMGCLVEALESIVAADKGRASELVQAKKTQQQAELSVVQSQSAMRLVENDLRRLVGEPLPGGEGLSALLLAVPPLAQIQAEAEQASEIVALSRQAQALSSFSEAQAAAQKPQVSWQLTGSKSVGLGSPGSFGVGVALNVPFINPGAEPASSAARKRAEAAVLQRDEALEQRRFRIAASHEQASASFERARLVSEVLRNSDRVRGFTLQQWQQLGKRSLFDVMSAEGDHFNLRVAYVNALHDGQIANATLQSLGRGLSEWLK